MKIDVSQLSIFRSLFRVICCLKLIKQPDKRYLKVSKSDMIECLTDVSVFDKIDWTVQFENSL